MTGARLVAEHLTFGECWKLLGQVEVGRLAVSGVGGVDVFPVNHRVAGERLLFRTGAGTKLVSLLVDHAVAFEVDGWNEHEAWSVVLKGTAEPLRDTAAVQQAEQLGLSPWAPEADSVSVEITVRSITGRRFPRPSRREAIWYA
jgi:uncharacterized protein